MHSNYFKSGLLMIAAIALLSACNTTPATQPTPVATATTPAPTATTTPTETATKTTETPTPSATTSPTSIFSGQREKAIESSGRLYLSSLARAQQAFYVEKGKFSSNIDDLGVGIKAEDNNYLLQITDTQPKSVTMTATAKQENVKSFAASVFVVGNTGNEVPIAVVCGTDSPSKKPPTGFTTPKSETDKPTCPTGSSPAK
ncbi:MAG: type IV pilin-like G/H family protein [Pseudanabaena sp.]